MKVLLTGANGWIGSAVARELINAGHSVVGLVRSKDEVERLAAVGITPLLGSLTDLDVLRQCAGDADGIIHTAFGLDFSNYEKLSLQDRATIEIFGEVFAGSDRPIVVTSGLGMLRDKETFTEDARPDVIPEYPRQSEQTAFALARRGIKICVVRPARSVHGLGERHGFVPQLAAIAREKGFSAYIGDGQNPWSAVHRLDVARVFRLALERGSGNEAYHAVAESVPFKLMAEAIGRQIGVPAKSVNPKEAETHFGGLAIWVTGSGRASSEKTKEVLGWKPQEIGLIADIDRPEYFG
jgi:nucleoside-diphosphate-sugar epimerase